MWAQIGMQIDQFFLKGLRVAKDKPAGVSPGWLLDNDIF